MLCASERLPSQDQRDEHAWRKIAFNSVGSHNVAFAVKIPMNIMILQSLWNGTQSTEQTTNRAYQLDLTLCRRQQSTVAHNVAHISEFAQLQLEQNTYRRRNAHKAVLYESSRVYSASTNRRTLEIRGRWLRDVWCARARSLTCKWNDKRKVVTTNWDSHCSRFEIHEWDRTAPEKSCSQFRTDYASRLHVGHGFRVHPPLPPTPNAHAVHIVRK